MTTGATLEHRSIANRLFFTVISVTEELKAFKVFETLNARGGWLSSTDLLKNFLFSGITSQAIWQRASRSAFATPLPKE